ncbi:hypothetical protein KEM56_003534, partial [Ascosphaera pollenicola]
MVAEIGMTDSKPKLQRDQAVAPQFSLNRLPPRSANLANSPAAAPVLVIRKIHGGILVCVDYRGLNEVNGKARCAVSLLSDTLKEESLTGDHVELTTIDRPEIILSVVPIRKNKGSDYSPMLFVFNNIVGRDDEDKVQLIPKTVV